MFIKEFIALSLTLIFCALWSGYAEAATPEEIITKVPKEKTAIVMVEFQNSWLDSKGDLNPLIKNQLEKKNAIENSVELVNRARESGIKLIYTPLSYSAGYPEIAPDQLGIGYQLRNKKRFQEGSFGADFYPQTAPKEGDYIARGRVGVSSFVGSNLEQILRAGGYTTIAVAGFATHICVESLIRDAYDRGYKVILLDDDAAAFDDNQDSYIKKYIMPHFGVTMSNDKFFRTYIK
jgi:nicotinamidase-related amidase